MACYSDTSINLGQHLNDIMEPKYTLKVNIRAQEEKERREKERLTREAISKLQSTSGPPSLPRKRRGLNFHQPGTFVAQGEQLRKKARLEALKKKVGATGAKTGITDKAKLTSLITSGVTEKKAAFEDGAHQDEDVPEVEWWDMPLIGKQSFDQVIYKLSEQTVKPEDIFKSITNLVEHPPLTKRPGPDPSHVQIPIFLTQKEKKKLRRQNRKNQELEKQEMMKMGLIPKPEPKLKRSNIMHALGDQAITNPSMAEQLVRDQEQKRLQAHIEHNESKKLDLEAKRDKKLRKIQEDLSVTGTWVAVYRIFNLSKQSRKLKIIGLTAKQLTMTGTICLTKNVNLVLVEGGPKQQRKFKHFILNRVKWAEEGPSDSTTEPAPSEFNRCLLVWEGQVDKRSFNMFKVRQCPDEAQARLYFKEFNVEHYFDLAHKMSILESISDT